MYVYIYIYMIILFDIVCIMLYYILIHTVLVLVCFPYRPSWWARSGRRPIAPCLLGMILVCLFVFVCYYCSYVMFVFVVLVFFFGMMMKGWELTRGGGKQTFKFQLCLLCLKMVVFFSPFSFPPLFALPSLGRTGADPETSPYHYY